MSSLSTDVLESPLVLTLMSHDVDALQSPPNVGLVSNSSSDVNNDDIQSASSDDETLATAIDSSGNLSPIACLDDQPWSTSAAPATFDVASIRSTTVNALCIKDFDKRSYRVRTLLNRIFKYKLLKFTQAALGAYSGYMTYRKLVEIVKKDQGTEEDASQAILSGDEHADTNDAFGTESAITAHNMEQVYLICMARISAYFMYPALIAVFISKFRFTTSVLARTHLSMYTTGDSHELHTYCGSTVLVCSILHTVAHLGQWASRGKLDLLWHHTSGITGVLAMAFLIAICLPMMMCIKCMKYELRKFLHYLYIPLLAALFFHAKPAFPNGGFTMIVFGTLSVWYLLDVTCVTLFMTEKINTTKFDVLKTGVQMTMRVSDAFRRNGDQGGYCYVCLPWVDKNQWHAFTLLENPRNPHERQIFIKKAGDWTNRIHEILQRDTVRPVWIQGPFPSPYDSAKEYDNQILVASGIGITPALSVICAHRDTRRINLIWVCRDRDLLEFFMPHLSLDSNGWNLVYYTGKEQLLSDHVDVFTNTNVCIIQGRPQLSMVIPNIIFGIESKHGLPEQYVPDNHLYSTNSGDGAGGALAANTANPFRDNRLGSDVSLDGTNSTMSFGSVGRSSRSNPRRRLNISALFKPTQKKLSVKEDLPKFHRPSDFKPWETHPASREFVKSMNKKLVLPTWALLYCGGSKILQCQMQEISYDYGLDLHVESFEW